MLLAVTAACAAPAALRGQDTAVVEPSHAWIARVSALGTSGTQLTGTVQLRPTGKANEYTATVDLRGAKLGNQIPWSISSGSCGEPSATELGDRVAYRVIQASADGTSRLNVTLKLIIPPALYHVDFFAGPAERDRVVSCGPLVPAP